MKHVETLTFNEFGFKCIDSNEILYSDKDHRILFVGCPNMVITNPRWRTVAILKISKIAMFQERFD